MKQSLIIISVFVVLMAGTFLWYTKVDAPATPQESEIVNPNEFGTYARFFDWPPAVQHLAEPYTCTEAGASTSRAGKTIRKVISDREYCVTEIVEGAAGSMYTQYAYATRDGEGTLIATFSTKLVQCENYDDPQKSDCKRAQSIFNPDLSIHQFISEELASPKD